MRPPGSRVIESKCGVRHRELPQVKGRPPAWQGWTRKTSSTIPCFAVEDSGVGLTADDAEFAVKVAMNVDAPVQVVWTREDTFAHGRYRPFTYQTMKAGLDAEGWPVAWLHRIYGQPPRGTTTGGAANPPYALPNFRCDNHLEDWGIPIGPWRSVANTQTAYAVESFMDECAHAAGVDPFEYRSALMRDANPRLLNCLEMVAERADWGRAMGERQGQGIAAWTCFTGYVAMVVEVTVDPDGTVHVDRVVSVSDHGTIINPEAVRSQIEGGVTLSLTAALKAGGSYPEWGSGGEQLP